MSTQRFSRRDLLRMGGRLVMTVGAAKVVVSLPGCSFPKGTSSIPGVDAPVPPIDAVDAGDAGQMLDDCHKIGTYHYADHYRGPPPYTYHSYWTDAHGCRYNVESSTNLDCRYDRYDYAPGYAYFCFTSYYYNITYP